MKKKKCICNLDSNFGPLGYNEDLKNEILKRGFKFLDVIPNEKDGESWGKDLRILHLPTGKINCYSSYMRFDKDSSYLTIFNGFHQEPVLTALDEFMWIYSKDLTELYSKERIKQGLAPLHIFEKGQMFKGSYYSKDSIKCDLTDRRRYVVNEEGLCLYSYLGAESTFFATDHLQQYEIDDMDYTLIENPSKEELELFNYPIKMIEKYPIILTYKSLNFVSIADIIKGKSIFVF